jgi:transcriptional regulator with XRE-family HTH domain
MSPSAVWAGRRGEGIRNPLHQRAAGQDRKPSGVEVPDGVRYVLVDEISVDGNGRGGPLASSGDDLGARIGHVAGHPDARDAGGTVGAGHHPAPVIEIAAQTGQQIVVRDEPGRHEHRGAGDDSPVLPPYAGEMVVLDHDPADCTLDDADGTSHQLGALFLRQGPGRGEEDDVVRPLANDLGVPDGFRAVPQDSELLVSYLPAVAVRAVQHIPRPPRPEPGDVGQLVAQPGRHKQPPGRYPLSAGHQNVKRVLVAPGHFADDATGDSAAVTLHLLPPSGQQVGGRQPVPGQEPLHVGCRRVARAARVDHEYPPPGPGQHQGRGQTGGSPTDDHYVKLAHGGNCGRAVPVPTTNVAIPGKGGCNGPMSDTATVIADALDQVGPRLKQLRTQRGVTLTALSEATGISKSTLSRLENGQRRASLEVLLPLAQAYRVPLDELVGAPEVGDPRVRLKASKINGRTVLPLTRSPGGLQAWKIIVPASNSRPAPKSHEGHEWLYVLSGQMRLILGDHDLVLGAGEAAEFDTRVPHWFGSTGDQPAEILSMFGPQGERAHTKARSVRKADQS